MKKAPDNKGHMKLEDLAVEIPNVIPQVPTMLTEEIIPPEIEPKGIDKLFFEYYVSKDTHLRSRIALKNQPLVTFIVNKYYSYKVQHKTLRDDLLQEGNIGLLSAIDGFDPYRGFRFSTYGCVPLTTQILTRRGWKHFGEIVDGDETIGYSAGKSHWTKIDGVQTYDDAPLVKFGDSLWSAVCTPEHKWLISQDEKVSLVPLTDWPEPKEYEWPSKKKNFKRPNIKLITSAPFVGGKSTLKPDEAAILAWVLSDGSLTGGRNNPTGAVIIQKATKFANEIRNLLKRNQAYCSDVKHGDNGCLAFTVKAKVFRKIWEKSKLSSRSISDLVLELTPKTRKAWFKAWYMAEGTLGANLISQNKGEKLEALELCAFLEGHNEIWTSDANKIHHSKCSKVTWHNLRRTPRRCVVKAVGHGPVWCPKTGLGSWTAKTEDGHIFLTGNTWWIRQAVNNYLINIEPTIHVPSHVRTAQNKLLRQLKEENTEFQELISSSLDTNKYPITNRMLHSIGSAISSKYIKSLDEEVKMFGGDDSGCSLKENLVDPMPYQDQKIDQKLMIKFVKKALKSLSVRERLVLLLRFNVITNEDIKRLIKKWTKQQNEEL